MLTLKSIIAAEHPDMIPLLDSGKIRLVRHVMNEWPGFDNALKFDNELLRVFSAHQGRDIYKDAEVVLVFVAVSGTRCLLRGAFSCQGKLSHDEFMSSYPAYLRLSEILGDRGIAVSNEGDYYFKLEHSDLLANLTNRLVIDWGRGAQSWVQTKLDKEVWEIYPKGFVSKFPGWESVLISHQELKAITANPDGNRDWYQFLSEHDGVYVILDQCTGKHYVGSAYAADDSGGIWGRWSGYAQTGTNGNQGLVELTGLDPKRCENFMYSIHHVCPKGGTSAKEVLHFEGLLKNKLGTRGADKLNRN